MNELREIDEGLWVADAPMRFLGLAVGTRMTVVRLHQNRLLLHSPVEARPTLVDEVKALGEVTCLVAPNRFHHLFVQSWQQACPGALTLAAPGLSTKRPDLTIHGTLEEQPHSLWAGVLDQVRIDGLPMLSETVFYHRATATLLLTDLAFNFRSDTPLVTRMVIRCIGRIDHLAPTLFERLAVRDRAALAQSLRRLLELPFERVIVTHGEILEQGGREQLAASFAWALRD